MLECGLVKSSTKLGSAIARINCDTTRLIYTVLANAIISQCSIASTGLEINPNSGVASRLRIATTPGLVRLESDRHSVCPYLTNHYKISLTIEVNRPWTTHRPELAWTARKQHIVDVIPIEINEDSIALCILCALGGIFKCFVGWIASHCMACGEQQKVRDNFHVFCTNVNGEAAVSRRLHRPVRVL